MARGSSTASELIRRLRMSAGLSQAELARRAGMPRSVINAYERGTREPGIEAFARIAAAAGMRIDLRPRVDRIDARRAGRLLEQVLDLAEALPYRPRRENTFPGLPSAAAV